jgi:hypothetical protein
LEERRGVAAEAKPKARRRAGNAFIDNRVEALRHHLRRKIMAHLTNEGPSSPSKMAKALKERLADVNYHTKRLRDLGCAELVEEKTSPGSPPEKIYKATERYLLDTEEWEDLDPAVKEGASGEFAQLLVDDLVAGFRAETLGTHKDFALIQNRIIVDEQGRDEAMEIEKRAMQEIQDVAARAGGRLSPENPGINLSVLQACFELPHSREKSLPDDA